MKSLQNEWIGHLNNARLRWEGNTINSGKKHHLKHMNLLHDLYKEFPRRYQGCQKSRSFVPEAFFRKGVGRSGALYDVVDLKSS